MESTDIFNFEILSTNGKMLDILLRSCVNYCTKKGN